MKLLPEEPRRRNAVLAAVLALCSAYAVHYYVYAPAQREADAARLRLAELKKKNRQADAATADGPEALERRLRLYEDHIARLERLIPADEEVPALLEAVSAEERRAGVDVAAMRPEPPEPGEFYRRRSYELQVVGGYHQVGSFMTAIASLERLVAPTDLYIAPAPDIALAPDPESGLDPTSGPDSISGGRVVATFHIRTYSRGG